MLIIPLCVGAYLIKTYFVRAAIQFERLNNTGRSPILVHTKSTLDGLITIRAAGRSSGIVETLVSEFHQKCDDHSKAFFNRISCQRWFGFRIDFICFLYVFLSLFITIFLKGIRWFVIFSKIVICYLIWFISRRSFWNQSGENEHFTDLYIPDIWLVSILLLRSYWDRNYGKMFIHI